MYGSDINPRALECCGKVAKINNNDIRLTDDTDALDEKFTAVLFNPPYVVTSSEELNEAQKNRGIDASCSGGRDGIEQLIKMLPMMVNKLDTGGSLYLLLIEENLKVLTLLTNMGFVWEVIMKRETSTRER